MQEVLFPNHEEEDCEKIYAIRREGHYDLLYTAQEQELDQYCFYTASYHFPSNSKGQKFLCQMRIFSKFIEDILIKIDLGVNNNEHCKEEDHEVCHGKD